ncbi:hypothetical protein MKC55_10890 [[Clostridium] innocuum]|nr:hypothetical protein [[Clostridium] innocuum]MCH1945597.1 hypothetical protein [[Clostridium] innocuum]MCH1956480.1 hypothetical protein [[Clostridium] innocuum]MCR0197126.1 hypothetical protein [[Clostridium] innocuum]MCR0338241.1 hypothetical protein [[Clostridium] innocuum]MCR0446149.1 hypothetical protein [[Clostridium] innocuum]
MEQPWQVLHRLAMRQPGGTWSTVLRCANGAGNRIAGCGHAGNQHCLP